MAAMYDFMNKINKIQNISKDDLTLISNFMENIDKVLGLLEKQELIPGEITKLAEERKSAKENKDWAKCDELRDNIQNLGYSIKDDKTSKTGYILNKI